MTDTGSRTHTAGLRAAGAAAALSLLLAACSSSGGGSGVSTSALESKLKKEPQIQSVIQQGGTQAKVGTQLVDCIAKALVKNANPTDLKEYVAGKKNLNDVGAKAKGSTNNAEQDAKTCAQSAISKDTKSAGR